MKRILSIIIISITLSIFFTGCLPIIWLVGEFQETREEGWATKDILNKLMSHSEKVLLTKDERNRASKAICALTHLDKSKNRANYKEKALEVCNIKENYKIFFLQNCINCGSGVGMIATSYLFVRDNKPFKYISIEEKYSKELGRSIPIVDRLH